MAMAKTGPKMAKGHRYSMPEASADDPIYTRGFAIGYVQLKWKYKQVTATGEPTGKTGMYASLVVHQLNKQYLKAGNGLQWVLDKDE
jgi:hypothetical protein